MGISVIQQVKALQAELGEARANGLVRKALGDIYRRYGEEFWRTKNEENLGMAVASAFATYARDAALDYNVIEQSQDAFAIGLRGGRGNWSRRQAQATQTIMQGASHCNFRYKRLRETD